MSIINLDIIDENVIDREELITYLTYLLENDEWENFFISNLIEDPYPDMKGFRDWLREQTFDKIIRESYFEEYIKDLYERRGEYDPNSFLHKHIDWDVVIKYVVLGYDRLFDDEEDHPFNIFKENFYYFIH